MQALKLIQSHAYRVFLLARCHVDFFVKYLAELLSEKETKSVNLETVFGSSYNEIFE